MARKRRRFGNVRQQPNGRWVARYKGEDKQERRAPHTFATYAEADRYLAMVEAQMRGGTWADPKAPPVTFGQFAADWLHDSRKRLKPSTLQEYGDILDKHILPTFARTPVGKITPADVRRWRADRLDHTGERRVASAYSLLRNILNTAVSDGTYATNPCVIRKAGSYEAPERPYLSRAQAEALADNMPTPELRTLVITTLWGHLRLGEVLAIRRGDFDPIAGTLTVQRSMSELRTGVVETSTKTKKARVVFLPTQAVDEVKRHLAATGPALPDARMFVHSSGVPLRVHHVRRAFTAARGALGLDGYHFHDLRHAGLTYVAQTGATLAEIKARGGHSTTKAAMIYQHVAQSRDQAIAAMLSDEPRGAADQVAGEA